MSKGLKTLNTIATKMAAPKIMPKPSKGLDADGDNDGDEGKPMESHISIEDLGQHVCPECHQAIKASIASKGKAKVPFNG